MRIYAIGDIHGQLERLREAHDRILRDGGEEAKIVHVGDLIDRGPDSRGVVELLMEGQARGRDWIVLKGNHDRALPNFLRDPRWIDPRAIISTYNEQTVMWIDASAAAPKTEDL